MSTLTWFAYVRHHEVEEHERLGWQAARVQCGHPGDAYSIIMVWGGDGEPIKLNTNNERAETLKPVERSAQ